jgi:urate oxidase
VTRLVDRHLVRELTIDVRLEGEFEASYTRGDNSRLIATDTMKNIVYALAQGRPAEAIDDFGAAVASHFLDSFAHVKSVTVALVEQPWSRITVGGREHPHAFVAAVGETRTSTVTADRGGIRFEAGLSGLQLMKTTGSGFSGFLRDRFTTLPETTDRIFATELQARWLYGATARLDWDDAHRRVRLALLETFADHDSHSVQHTLHAMGAAVLDACEDLVEITLVMPNKHRVLVELERFGLENRNEVFIATDEPFGLISGTLGRV